MPEKIPVAAPGAPVLILMRHAARDFSGDSLSAEGNRQALSLPTILTSMMIPHPNRIESSPKSRTQATLKFLAKATSLKTVVDPRLDERSQGETAEAFEMRVENFLDECASWAASSNQPEDANVRLACSHLDWLEEAVLRLDSDENDFERSEPWPPLAIRGYIFIEGIWKRMKVKL